MDSAFQRQRGAVVSAQRCRSKIGVWITHWHAHMRVSSSITSKKTRVYGLTTGGYDILLLRAMIPIPHVAFHSETRALLNDMAHQN
jgi:hypothetical protein